MLAIGFDPAFIDTIVRVEDEKGGLVDELPQPGYHHRRTDVKRIAGGNAVNIAYVLNKLGVPINLVIPSNHLFDKLLERKELECTYRLHETVNETVAVLWGPGEIQFNQVIGSISEKHFTKQVHEYWSDSPIQVSVNWGLNYDSPYWLSCLWLTSCGWNFDRINELEREELLEAALGESNLQNRLVLEPGSVKEHPMNDELVKLLETISRATYGEIYPIFSCNEEEFEEYRDLEFTTKLVHTSKTITKYQGAKKQIIEVPKLENIKTYVGAGDSFLAGIIHELYLSNKIDTHYAISVAQRYMTDRL